MPDLVLGLDTATPSTVAAVLPPEGAPVEARDDPPPDERPRHASRVLALIERALTDAGAHWDDVGRIAVGIGPGGFTGLRIGIATARALSQARGLPLVPVGTLDALAAPLLDAGERRPVAAVLDARRGEVFAAIWRDGRRVLDPVALAPAALAERLRALPEPPLAIGDGSLRFRQDLEQAGATVAPSGFPRHRVSAVAVCRLGAAGTPADRDAILPDYRREPDAKPQ
jgi:tRNA threonylcarbamoyladenosine biosynthesis protein TsaB